MNTQTNDIWQDNPIQFARLLAEIAAVADLSTEQLEAVAESMDLDTSEVHTLFVRAENEFERLKQSTFNSPSVITGDGNQFNILETDIFKDYLTKAIDAVKSAAEDANVSPTGFEIDDAMCDCGEIETSDVADVIDEAAQHFGSYDSNNYKFIVDALCEAVTEHFAKK